MLRRNEDWRTLLKECWRSLTAVRRNEGWRSMTAVWTNEWWRSMTAVSIKGSNSNQHIHEKRTPGVVRRSRLLAYQERVAERTRSRRGAVACISPRGFTDFSSPGIVSRGRIQASYPGIVSRNRIHGSCPVVVSRYPSRIQRS